VTGMPDPRPPRSAAPAGPGPAGRLTLPEVLSQGSSLGREGLLTATLDRLQGLIAVVNQHNQIIFANAAFASFFGAAADDLRGMKPGEVFHCLREPDGGCGLSEGCGFCGTLMAIDESRGSRAAATRDCSMAGMTSGRLSAHEFRVRAIPFDVSGEHFVLVSLRDISGQKRRQALERIFFHDILNTASGMKVTIDLLKAGPADSGSRALLERLEGICETLVDEIQSQKILVSAENGTLTIQRSLIESTSLITEVTAAFEGQEVARERRIVIAPFSESVTLVSDDSLLRRVITNMLKNALEATPEGGTVSIGFRPDGGRARFWVNNPGVIPEQARRQIFRRYFSTKGADRGLGTFSMKLLTEEYLRGSIGFESSPAGGTTFTVSVPLTP
jgi:nitrogen-specific signal transduction histidine kinase